MRPDVRDEHVAARGPSRRRRRRAAARASCPAARAVPNSDAGSASAATRSSSHARRAGSNRPVVDAFVSSCLELAGQPVADEVRDHRHPRGAVEPRRGRVGGQLVQRVERQELGPRAGVQAFRGYAARRPPPRRRRCARRDSGTARRRASRPRPAGRSRTPHESTATPARSPAAAPARRRPSRIERYSPSMSQCSPSGERDRVVGEAVDLLDRQRAPAVEPDPADDDAPARGPEVDRRERAGPPGGRPRAHRRNAAATPASTGMWRPVVWLRSPPVSANTAAATCSGQDLALEDRALRVELAQLVLGDAVGAGAVGAPALGEDPGSADHAVRVHAVDPDPERPELRREQPDLVRLVGLRRAVGDVVRAGEERVLAHDVDDVAAHAPGRSSPAPPRARRGTSRGPSRRAGGPSRRGWSRAAAC